MKNVKVVLFPGAPVNVEVEGNETVREVFAKAGLDFEGRELKIDGRTVSENDLIGNANMLIAMKKIKGNAKIKVVNFPGAPVEIEIEEGMIVREAFEKANIDFEGRELKLDGRQVNIDDLVEGGRMLIAMKKIKGNGGYEVGTKLRAFDMDIVRSAYGYDAPFEGEITEIDMEDGILAIDDFYMDLEFVINNYELVKEIVETNREEFENTFEEMARELAKDEINKSENLIGLRIEKKLQELIGRKEYLLREVFEVSEKIELLESVLN